jgi:hypothetical protein
MARETVYIAQIVISARMAEKLASSGHGTSAEEIRDTFELPGRPQRHEWNDHPEYGRRLYVEGLSPSGRRLLAILQPTSDPDVFRLRTGWAY